MPALTIEHLEDYIGFHVTRKSLEIFRRSFPNGCADRDAYRQWLTRMRSPVSFAAAIELLDGCQTRYDCYPEWIHTRLYPILTELHTRMRSDPRIMKTNDVVAMDNYIVFSLFDLIFVRYSPNKPRIAAATNPRSFFAAMRTIDRDAYRAAWDEYVAILADTMFSFHESGFVPRYRDYYLRHRR